MPQVILESILKFVGMIADNAPGPIMTWVPIGLLIGDFIAKTSLFIGNQLKSEIL